MNTIAVYPGSFDPITNGHLDIVARATAVFDTVIIGVLANPRKTPLLPVETRIEVIRAALADRRFISPTLCLDEARKSIHNARTNVSQSFY